MALLVKRITFVCVGLIIFSCNDLLANLTLVELRGDKKIAASREVLAKTNIEGGQWLAQLRRLKQAVYAGDSSKCVRELSSIEKKAQLLTPWLLALELNCRVMASQSGNRSQNTEQLVRVIKRVESQPWWLIHRPFADTLRKNVVTAKIRLLEIDLAGNKTRAWQTIDELTKLSDWMTDVQMATVLKLAADLAFSQQNILVARDFAMRSLAISASPELEKKLLTIENSLGIVKQKDSSTANMSNGELEGPEEERDLAKRMLTAIDSSDMVSAVEDGVKLIRDYPGSKRSRWAANRLISIYLGILEKNSDQKFASLIEHTKKQLLTSDGMRAWEWGKMLFNKRYYAESLDFFDVSLTYFNKTTMATEILLYAAKAAYNIDNFIRAGTYYTELITKHSGTDESREALFFAALIEYRQAKYGNAIAYLERLLTFPQNEKWELSASYWMWRSLQKLNSPRAEEIRKTLVEKYPFTYYGLRANFEVNDGKVVWRESNFQLKDLNYKMWLTKSQHEAWQRLNLLLEAGWLDEARQELRLLPIPRDSVGRLLFARYWAAALGYIEAMDLIDRIWRENPAWQTREVLAIVFPFEFNEPIENEAKKYALDPVLIYSLIRQESGYAITAISRSQAVGLMQLIPATAQEVASDLRLKNFDPQKDLLLPATNIRLGSYYLARMINRFNRHVLLALAAYNAGPTRVNQWLELRPSLQNIKNVKSSEPLDEMWIEELPWSETRFYVKAIMRNSLIYRMFRDNKINYVNSSWESLLK